MLRFFTWTINPMVTKSSKKNPKIIKTKNNLQTSEANRTTSVQPIRYLKKLTYKRSNFSTYNHYLMSSKELLKSLNDKLALRTWPSTRTRRVSLAGLKSANLRRLKDSKLMYVTHLASKTTTIGFITWILEMLWTSRPWTLMSLTLNQMSFRSCLKTPCSKRSSCT